MVHHRPFVKFLFHLLLLTTLSALAGAAWVAHRPADLAGVNGLQAGDPARPRDVVDELKQVGIKRSAIVEVSEADLNRHLARVLAAKLPAQLEPWAAFERLVLDLEPDVARLTLVWNLRGHRSTATVDLRVVRQAQAFRTEITGGGYGRLRVPRGLLRPLAPALTGLAAALQEEIDALFQMNQMRVLKDKLVLDPRFP